MTANAVEVKRRRQALADRTKRRPIESPRQQRQQGDRHYRLEDQESVAPGHARYNSYHSWKITSDMTRFTS